MDPLGAWSTKQVTKCHADAAYRHTQTSWHAIVKCTSIAVLNACLYMCIRMSFCGCEFGKTQQAAQLTLGTCRQAAALHRHRWSQNIPKMMLEVSVHTQLHAAYLGTCDQSAAYCDSVKLRSVRMSPGLLLYTFNNKTAHAAIYVKDYTNAELTPAGACNQHAGRASSPLWNVATLGSSVWPFLAESTQPAGSCKGGDYKTSSAPHIADWLVTFQANTLFAHLCTHLLGYQGCLIFAAPINHKHFGTPSAAWFTFPCTAIPKSKLTVKCVQVL